MIDHIIGGLVITTAKICLAVYLAAMLLRYLIVLLVDWLKEKLHLDK